MAIDPAIDGLRAMSLPKWLSDGCGGKPKIHSEVAVASKMDGSIEAIGGQLYAWGNTDGVGTAALFNGTRGIVADRAGNIYVSCFNDNTIRKGVPAGAPVITTQPQTLRWRQTTVCNSRSWPAACPNRRINGISMAPHSAGRRAAR